MTHVLMYVRWRMLGMIALVAIAGTGVSAQRVCSQDPLNAVTINEILHTVPWDSMCHNGCQTLAIDSTVRIVTTPGIVPHKEPVYHRITSTERARISLRGRSIQWGDIDADLHRDTTHISLALLRRPREPEKNTFLVIALPPRSFGHWMTIRLICSGAGWTAVYKGDFEG